ncbi:MAG TPA: rhodanese-like domain-containing protein [Candidatus Dormibacteraeota bacterium]|nr:rhodanese-like domain-containing protein [Candidatus Dormibacteraeota bacterium]
MEWSAPYQLELAAARQALERGAVLLDVREAAERSHMRIGGSMWIPLPELGGRVGEVPRGRPVIVYCTSGSRSLRAIPFLRARGVDAAGLVAGLMGWLEARLPTEAGAPRAS